MKAVDENKEQPKIRYTLRLLSVKRNKGICHNLLNFKTISEFSVRESCFDYAAKFAKHTFSATFSVSWQLDMDMRDMRKMRVGVHNIIFPIFDK